MVGASSLMMLAVHWNVSCWDHYVLLKQTVLKWVAAAIAVAVHSKVLEGEAWTSDGLY